MASILEIAGSVLIAAGAILMVLGTFGLLKFKRFYPRILISSKIDTVGMLTLLLGLVVRHGFSFFSAKIVLIIVILLILNPLVAHILSRSAYMSGE
ncbi:MAG: monovalent cation/H(+) antiporter subunit G [Oscillospiraceae bacterium]|nr:monovalent cation/H(+) antiporter subunit G [Oscillospiraceae bacterium]